MRYSAARKINLSSIDASIWAYETEDIGVSDADSIDEAFLALDRAVADRIQVYQRRAHELKAKKLEPTTIPISSPLPTGPGSSITPGTFIPKSESLPLGVTNKPPADFE